MVKERQSADQNDPCIWARNWQCIIICLGFTVAFAMRVNASVAVVAMTDKNATNPDFEEFAWDTRVKSYILSSFFVGYISTQLPAGYLANKYGGKTNLFYGLLIGSITSLLTPMGARYGGWKIVCLLRLLGGVSQGVLVPSIHTILSKWAPPEERSIMSIYSYSGQQFGIVLMLASSGVIASSSIGWPGIFYVPGVIGMLWCIVYYIWGASTPDECTFITSKEQKYIENSLAHNSASAEERKNLAFPIKSALTSVPFLVLIIAHCSYAWGFYTLLTQIPTYMKNVLKMDIKSNALLSAMPYFSKLVLGLLLSLVSKAIIKHNALSLQTTRRLFNTLGFWIPGALLLVLSYVDAAYPITVIILLNILTGFNASTLLGFMVNHIDLSPNFAGILMSITNFSANVHSAMAPLVIGRILTDPDDTHLWRIVFFIAATYYFVGNLLFITFGSTDVQPWNNPKQVPKLLPTSEEDALKIEMKEQQKV